MTELVHLPGFFDLQINGFAGIDFNRPGIRDQDIQHVVGKLLLTGVTRFLPTFITSDLRDFRACVAPWLRSDHEAVAGFHMEGPYINPQDGPRGAHEAAFVQAPSREDFLRRQDAAQGRIRLVTLAPEIPGALALIEFLAAQNVCVAIGHSCANRQQIRDAVSAGARLSTHLGNATPQLVPRYDNVIWQQLACDELTASLIVDGHHLHADTVKIMVRAKTAERVVLVSDAMAAAGQAPGAYTLGDIAVTLDAEGRALRNDTQRLAGSALTLDRAVALTTQFAGVTLQQAAAMAGAQAAALLGEATWGQLEALWEPQTPALTVVKVKDQPSPTQRG